MSESRLGAVARRKWAGLPVWSWAVIGLLLIAMVAVLLVWRGGRGEPGPAPEPLAEVEQQIEAGEYDEAVATLEVLRAEEPDDPQSTFLLWQAARAAGDEAGAAQAQADLQAGAESGRGGTAGWYWLFRLASENGDEDLQNTALTALSEAVASEPDDPAGHFLLGRAYNQASMLEQAAVEFRRVIELEPDNAAAHHNLGVTYYQLMDPNAAVAEFEQALALDPEDADTHYQLGATYLVMALAGGDPNAADPELVEQAVKEFDQALALEPGKPEALIGLGNVYIQRGEYPEAVAALEEAIAGAPDLPEAYYALGEAYARQSDATRACQAYSQFTTMNPPAIWLEQARQSMALLGCE